MESLWPVLAMGLVVALVAGWIAFIVWMVRRSRRASEAHASAAVAFDAAVARMGARRAGDVLDNRWAFSHGGRQLEAQVRPQNKAPPIYALSAIVKPVPGRAGAPFRSAAEVALARLPPMVLRPEHRRDRLGKALGLNREVQTGDAGFDAAVYIESEAADEEVERVLASPAAREAVLGLFARGARRVAFADPHGAVVAEWSGHLERDPFAGGGLEAASSHLAALAEALPPVAAIGVRPRWPRGAGWVVAAASALAVGIVTLVVGRNLYKPFDAALDTRAAMLGAVIACGVTLAAFLAIRQTSTALRMLTWTFVVGMFGFPVLCAGLAEIANGAFDDPPEARLLRVVGQRVKTGKSNTYYVTFAPFEPYVRPVEISVSSREHALLRPGTHAHILVGEGALGQPWYGGLPD